MRRKLHHPVDLVSVIHPDYEDHRTPIQQLIGPEGMRVIGRAHDLGIVVPESDEHRKRAANYAD